MVEHESVRCELATEHKVSAYDPLSRLEEQISWYDRKSLRAQFSFKTIKIIQILLTALIPVISQFQLPSISTINAIVGLTLLLLEGIQQLNQYQQLWMTYRSTCEALKHEKYTFLASGGPYYNCHSPRSLLADRIEGLISQEHARWVTTVKPHSSTSPSDK